MGNNKRTIKILHDNPLGRHYLSLDEHGRQVFLHRSMTRLGIAQTTIYRWMRGVVTPRKTEAIALGEITGIAPSELYPELFILDNIINNQ